MNLKKYHEAVEELIQYATVGKLEEDKELLQIITRIDEALNEN